MKIQKDNLHIRIEPQLMKLFRSAAKAEKTSLSAWVRDVLRGSIREDFVEGRLNGRAKAK